MPTHTQQPPAPNESDEIVDAELVELDQDPKPDEKPPEQSLVLSTPQTVSRTGITPRKVEAVALHDEDVIGEAIRRVQREREKRLGSPKSFEDSVAKKLAEIQYPGLIVVDLQRMGRVKAKEYEIAAAIMNSMFSETEAASSGVMGVTRANHWKEFEVSPGTLGGFLERYGTDLFTEIGEKLLIEKRRTTTGEVEFMEYKGKKRSWTEATTPTIDEIPWVEIDLSHQGNGGTIEIRTYNNPDLERAYLFRHLENSKDNREHLKKTGLRGMMSLKGAKASFLRRIFDVHKDDEENEFPNGDFEKIDIGAAIRMILYKLRDRAKERNIEPAGSGGIAEIDRIFGDKGPIEQQLGWLLTNQMFKSVGDDELPVNKDTVQMVIDKMLADAMEQGEIEVKPFEMPQLHRMDKVQRALSRHLLRAHFAKKALGAVAEMIDPEIEKTIEILKPGKLAMAFTKLEREKRAKRREVEREKTGSEIEALYDGFEYAYKLHTAGKACVAKYDGSEREQGQMLLALAQIYLEHLQQVAKTIDMQKEIDASGITEMQESIYALAGVPRPQDLQKELLQKAMEIGHALRGVQRVREEDPKRDEDEE